MATRLLKSWPASSRHHSVDRWQANSHAQGSARGCNLFAAGKEIKTVDHSRWQEVLASSHPGSATRRIRIEDRRRPRNASPRLETRDELRFPELGFQVAETNNGLMITQDFGNSPAATANLTPRCFILEVERKPVNTLDDLRQIERRSNDGMLLRVRFPNNEERLVVIK